MRTKSDFGIGPSDSTLLSTFSTLGIAGKRYPTLSLSAAVDVDTYINTGRLPGARAWNKSPEVKALEPMPLRKSP